ncbi:MAG: hypothetical protein IPH54_09885 [Rhodoferax sp.]|nr:hypothetical protein [Rhodoferax sp.]
MSFRFFKLFAVALVTAVLLGACGGESAPAPINVKAVATESTVTLTWDMTPGVEYWLFYGPSANVPADTNSMHNWVGVSKGGALTNVTSPFVVTGLINNLEYKFSINGRTSGGPGGPGSTPQAATPRFAGSNWALGPSNPLGSNDLRSVTYGRIFLATGNNGTLYSSTDGLAWGVVSSGTASNLNGSTFFVNYKVVGDGGLILTSNDAVLWTTQTSGTTQNLNAIASNFYNLHVAVGANGTILTSPDAVTWTTATSPTTQHLYGITYGGGSWVAVGAAGTVLKSSDGVNWALSASGSSMDLTDVAFGGASLSTTAIDAFVVVGASGTLLRSPDGVVWTPLTLPVSVDLKAVTFGSQFVTVGAAGKVLTSPDGITWTASDDTKTTNTLYAVARGYSTYSAVGAGGTNLLAQ